MINIENVTKSFPSKVVFSNVSITIKNKSIFGLVGINGAGKSTFLRCLTNVYNFDEGKVLIDNHDSSEAEVKNNIFFLNDDPFFLRTDTPLTLASFYKAFYPNFDEHYYRNMLTSLKIEEKGKVVNFSKGMRRQAAVICAISAGTEYLLLDEVFDGLDPTMRLVVRKMLVDAMADTGLTVVMSSHNLGEIEGFCDRVGLLFNGSLVFNREIDTLKGSVHKVQAAFAREVTRDDFKDIEIMNIKKQGSVYNIIVKGDEAKIKQRAEELGAMLCDIVPLSLEEVFIYELEVLGYDFDGIDR